MVKKKVKSKQRKPVWKPKKGDVSKFPKGTSGNPNGRPKGTKNRFSIAELAQAIKNVEKKKKIKFMEHWVESSLNDPNAMSNIMNYMLPKLRAIEGILTTFESSMPDDVAAAIRKKLLKRWGINSK